MINRRNRGNVLFYRCYNPLFPPPSFQLTCSIPPDSIRCEFLGIFGGDSGLLFPGHGPILWGVAKQKKPNPNALRSICHVQRTKVVLKFKKTANGKKPSQIPGIKFIEKFYAT